MNKQDFFKVLVDKGILKVSGFGDNLKPYRIIEYQGKEFKISLEEIGKWHLIQT